MKNYIYKTTCLIVLIATAIACGDTAPDEPSEQELTFENLAGQWGLPATGGIVVDGVDQSLNYEGFNLSFTDGGYNTSNAGTLFQATGTWEWANESTTTQINLDDGKSVNIQNLSTTEFVFSFIQTTGGVSSGTNGDYLVTLNK